MVTCAREGHVRLAELSSTGTCKTTRKLAQHHGAAHKVSVCIYILQNGICVETVSCPKLV